MSEIDRKAVEAAVRASLAELLQAQERAEAVPKAFEGDLMSQRARCDDGTCRPRSMPHVPVFDKSELAQLKAATPARLAQGRTGTRYLTGVYVGLRAEHAIALDAVHGEVPDDLPQKLGCISLRTRCKSRDEYLLHPDAGRRLDDESAKRLTAEGTRGADVQIICGDGLAAWALIENGPALLPALTNALTAARFKLGKPLFVKFARVGVQDEIGVALQSKCTVILVGERPGLGTGDSLSIYTAFNPRMGQDNAEKDCISNIRPLGLKPAEAARECTQLLQRTFAAGGGGVKLTQSGT
ncbi:MAG: ethanolamine ammonia-lyase subunit EutC [Deltaproteobacteria bacterium]|nr:ethanolamine ammonia-lyase subunit EutC [Deltaproteobacteria bacterium]